MLEAVHVFRFVRRENKMRYDRLIEHRNKHDLSSANSRREKFKNRVHCENTLNVFLPHCAREIGKHNDEAVVLDCILRNLLLENLFLPQLPLISQCDWLICR